MTTRYSKERLSEHFRECSDCNKVWHISEFRHVINEHDICPDCDGRLCWISYDAVREFTSHYWHIKPAVERYLASLEEA